MLNCPDGKLSKRCVLLPCRHAAMRVTRRHDMTTLPSIHSSTFILCITMFLSLARPGNTAYLFHTRQVLGDLEEAVSLNALVACTSRVDRSPSHRHDKPLLELHGCRLNKCRQHTNARQGWVAGLGKSQPMRLICLRVYPRVAVWKCWVMLLSIDY